MQIVPLRLVFAVAVEHLHAMVFAVGDIDEAVGIGCDVVYDVELAGIAARLAPACDQFSVRAEIGLDLFKPAELPTKPKYPVRVILVFGGALLGLFLSIGVAAALDLASGRFIEPWQVRRRLALPVLGEVAGP